MCCIHSIPGIFVSFENILFKIPGCKQLSLFAYVGVVNCYEVLDLDETCPIHALNMPYTCHKHALYMPFVMKRGIYDDSHAILMQSNML